MQIYYDENGDIVDVSNVVTATFTVELTGSGGTKKYFVRNHQYVFTGTENREIDCDACANEFNVQMMEHYIIVVDEETYYLPGAYGAVEHNLRPQYFQNIYTYYEWRSKQPADFLKATKETLGVDLEKINKSELHNGYDYYQEKKKEKLPKKVKGYKVEKDHDNEQERYNRS